MKPGLTPWPKGVSGNPGGRSTKPMIDRLLEEALTANDSATAKIVADKLISMATHGSLHAIRLVEERTEGRPKNAADAQEKGEAKLTKEQIHARLAELLAASPEIKDDFAKLLFGQEKIQ